MPTPTEVTAVALLVALVTVYLFRRWNKPDPSSKSTPLDS